MGLHPKGEITIFTYCLTKSMGGKALSRNLLKKNDGACRKEVFQMTRSLRLGLSMLCLAVSFVVADETLDNLLRSGKYKEAIEYADQKIPPASRDAGTWVKVAEANEKIGLTEKALACYMVSWRMNPNDYASLLGAARIYNKLDQPEEAMKMAEKALDQKFTGQASWEYARAAIALKRPAEAKRALEKVIETDSANIVANRELGLIYYNEKEYAKAAELLKKSYGSEPDPDVAYKIGKSYLESGNTQQAIEYLKGAIEKKKSLYQAGLDLARAYFDLGKYLAAANEYDRIKSKVKMTAEDYYKLGAALEESNKNLEAVGAYRSAIGEFGNSKSAEAINARLKVGKADLAAKKYKDALVHLRFLATADPDAKTVRDIYFLLADAYVGTNNSSQAIENLEKAISLDSKNIEAYARLADLYEKNGMQSKAKATYEKMMSLSPNDPNVYLTLGEYNLNAKKYSEAIKLFVKSNGLQKSAAALEGIAISAAALEQWDKARDAAESAIAMNGDLVESRKVLAEAYFRSKNYQGAIPHLEFLVTKEPKSLEYWTSLAECYDKTGDKQKLAEADKKIISLDKKNVDSRRRFAEYSLRMKDEDTAYELYKELAVLTPKDASVFKNLFLLAKEKREKKQAIQYLKDYLALNSNDAEGQKNLGDLLYETGDKDGALAAYRAALKIDPTIKGFHKQYAELVIAKGQTAEVITALSGVIKSGEADFNTYSTLGSIYQERKDYSKAIEMYQKALQIDPQNTETLVNLAESQSLSGDIGGAVITYEQAIMMNPNLNEEYKALGDLYTEQGKKKQAIEAYEKYLEKSPNDQAIAKTVGDYYFNMKQYDKALKSLILVKGEMAEVFSHRQQVAEARFHTEDYKGAIPVLQSLRERNPKHDTLRDLLTMLAKAYQKVGDKKNAAEVLAAYLAMNGVSDSEAAYRLASLYEDIDPPAAEKRYGLNIQYYPKDYRNYLKLGMIYSKDKATLPKAAKMLERAAGLAGEMPGVWLEIAQVYGRMDKSDQELEAYKKFMDADPKNAQEPKILLRVGNLLLEKKKYTEAIINLETANTLAPGTQDVMLSLAKGYLRTNRAQEAVTLLEKAKAKTPEDVEIRKNLVEVYRKLGDTKRAREELKNLIDKKRDNSLLLLYAKMLMEDGKYKDAADAIEDIRATDPENIDALMTLAAIQRARKKYDDAIETYKEVIYINADYAPAIYERAEVYLLQEKPQWALKFYQRALRAAPDFALAELGLAKIAKLQKDQNKYAQHVRKAYKLDPNNSLIKDAYGSLSR